MTPIELFALSLALSIAVAAIAGLTAAGLERATTDPALRDRAWAWALYLPVLPPLAVATTLLTPAPVRPIPILPTPTLTTEVIEALPVAIAPATPALTLDLGQLALAALILAALLVFFRLASLALRGWRLNRLIARTQPASPDTRTIVAECAARLGVASPTVRAVPAVGDALLTGLTRPVLVLPQAVADTPDTLAAHAVITHELAHLKRGDHRAVWIEEAVVALLAANPILPLIRARGAAAREEACDALALAGADPVARRAYATSLIEALRARTDPTTLPALTFNGTPRSQAMRRLKSILTPPATAGRGTKTVAVAASVALLGLAGAGSMAVAAQRAPQAAPDTDVMPLATRDHAYVGAAMDPIFKVAWPGACGFGSEGPDGQVFVHAGEGCPTLGGPRILIRTLAGADLSSDPRAAFDAVKAACEAGRPVEIAYIQGGRSNMKTVACASTPIAPPQAVRFTTDITYDPAIAIVSGDRLEITLARDVEGGGTASTGMVLDLAPGAMPSLAFADLRPPLLPADRNGPMFRMTARIVGVDGAVKALSDRDLGRNHAPYISTATTIWTRLQMVPAVATSATDAARDAVAHATAATGAQDFDLPSSREPGRSAAAAVRQASAAARNTLTPQQRARFRNPSLADYRRICASEDPADDGFCSGVIFSQLNETGVCPPTAVNDPDDTVAGRALGTVVTGAKAQFDSIPATAGQTLPQFTLAALRKAYPCPPAR